MSGGSTYQKPKADHPWRQYDKSKKTTTDEEINIIHIQQFLSEITTNWDKYEITTVNSFEGVNHHKLSTLPQKKIAAWLVSMLKRNYVDRKDSR